MVDVALASLAIVAMPTIAFVFTVTCSQSGVRSVLPELDPVPEPVPEPVRSVPEERPENVLKPPHSGCFEEFFSGCLKQLQGLLREQQFLQVFEWGCLEILNCFVLLVLKSCPGENPRENHSKTVRRFEGLYLDDVSRLWDMFGNQII